MKISQKVFQRLSARGEVPTGGLSPEFRALLEVLDEELSPASYDPVAAGTGFGIFDELPALVGREFAKLARGVVEQGGDAGSLSEAIARYLAHADDPPPFAMPPELAYLDEPPTRKVCRVCGVATGAIDVCPKHIDAPGAQLVDCSGASEVAEAVRRGDAVQVGPNAYAPKPTPNPNHNSGKRRR